VFGKCTLTPPQTRHNGGVRPLIRDGVISVMALALWPFAGLLAVTALLRRARRGEPVIGRQDVAWLGRRAVLATGVALLLWIVAASLVAFASIFVAIPDI